MQRNRSHFCRARVLLALVCSIASGCVSDQDEASREVAESTRPANATVKVLANRADYVDAVVSGERFEYRFLLPPTDDCRAIAAADDARYTNWGVLGTLRRDELRCEPVGILSLEKWRDRRPRSKGPPVPREQAVYDVFYRDDELALARGRFVLAGKIGFSGGVDSVAVIPNTDECSGVLSRRVSSMEFRPAGPNPLVLIDGDGRCPLLGIARPLGPPPPPEK